jgi:hypothetical protein
VKGETKSDKGSKSKKFDYYLSYEGTHSKMSTQPLGLAQWLHDELTSQGLRGFMPQPLNPVPAEKLEQITADTSVLLVCLHDETCASVRCQEEWRVAEENGLPVLCMADLQNCKKQDLVNQVKAIGDYLLQNQWQEYVHAYRRSVVRSCANMVRHYSLEDERFDSIFPFAHQSSVAVKVK